MLIVAPHSHVCVYVQDTYRYHGHSISDPGSTYRTRDEISGIRRARDPIEHVKTLLIENKFAEGSDLKKREKQIKREVFVICPCTSPVVHLSCTLQLQQDVQ